MLSWYRISEVSGLELTRPGLDCVRLSWNGLSKVVLGWAGLHEVALGMG